MKVSGNYSDLWKAIIRPPREEYTLQNLGTFLSLYLLGPNAFKIGKRSYLRKDLELINPIGLRLRCSHFFP